MIDHNPLQCKKLFLFDLDGTLYLGDRLFPGVRELLSAIRARGGQYRFLTNNSSRSIAAYVKKLTRLGVATEAADFLTSVDALIHYLREHGGEDRRYYVCGTESMKSQLRAAGFTVAERREDANALLMGFDTELTFQKLEDACILLGQGVPYVATNPDLLSRVYHIFQRKNIYIREPDRFTAYRTPICKKPHARHLDGANMGLEVSLAYSGTRNRSWRAAAVSSLESCFTNARLRENRFFILPR